MEATIEVSGLSKRFGNTPAVDDLSFVVQPGRITGFVGPNGAGKSTTMRMILGLDHPDSGHALVGGRRYASLHSPLREAGALLDAAAMHKGRRAGDHLLWLARSNGIPSGRVAEVLHLVGLEAVARKRVGTFSLGMKQRLGIAAAVLGDPPVLLLDEPVNGLDPEGIRWLRGFLRGYAAEGRAVLISSHLMSELEDTADQLIVIGRGRLIADTTVAGLLAATGGERVTLRTPDRAPMMTVLAAAGASVTSTGGDALTVSGLPADCIGNLAAEHHLRLHELSPVRISLEDAFFALTGGAVEYRGASEGKE